MSTTTNEPATSERQFWSDDFDMDLPKVLPEAWKLIQQAPPVLIYTHGHRTFGRLNHPSCWNDDKGIVAYFGFDQVCGKPAYCVGSEEVVECTFAEACRDAWPHHYRLLLEGECVLDTWLLVRQFDALMYDLRGWNERLTPRRRYYVERAVTRVFADATYNFERLCRKFRRLS